MLVALPSLPSVDVGEKEERLEVFGVFVSSDCKMAPKYFRRNRT